jgi:hypothetical protein
VMAAPIATTEPAPPTIIVAPPPVQVIRLEPVREAESPLSRLRASAKAHRVESQARMQALRARSEAMRAETERMMNDAFARARSTTGAPVGFGGPK